ncbi:hypothetical protein BO99DRAFT_71170 [Aspergillus violaceofuscus CBS 115571]|uniref:Uncharacterized protein n=1 Tax=Aspergillus violaceofuscus (strain CBS 115571) TaxID=1450538 RepID=A0A2V5HD27_ASPV1|nr:hypothetical protein BO99DRAFT_71170 [Aspergillus violaceofuscus CBS 115571]
MHGHCLASGWPNGVSVSCVLICYYTILPEYPDLCGDTLCFESVLVFSLLTAIRCEFYPYPICLFCVDSSWILHVLHCGSVLWPTTSTPGGASIMTIIIIICISVAWASTVEELRTGSRALLMRLRSSWGDIASSLSQHLSSVTFFFGGGNRYSPQCGGES